MKDGEVGQMIRARKQLQKALDQDLPPAARKAVEAALKEINDPDHVPGSKVGSDAWYIAEARDRHAEDGEVEIDDGALISRGADDGAYVHAWVWVPNDE